VGRKLKDGSFLQNLELIALGAICAKKTGFVQGFTVHR
jgi:hypothetical protein